MNEVELYKKIEVITKMTPTTNWVVSKNSKYIIENVKEMTIERQEANPLRRLSAYLITIATRSPTTLKYDKIDHEPIESGQSYPKIIIVVSSGSVSNGLSVTQKTIHFERVS